MPDDFRGLTLWQEAKQLRDGLYRLAGSLPPEERFRLADQLIRASRSVTANIAEGHGRYGYRDMLRFMLQARGSLHELIDHLDVAIACGFVPQSEAERWITQANKVVRLLNGYARYLRERGMKGSSEWLR